MKKLNIFSSFTLAEILVTLMILGTIAAISLPALKNHADEQKFIGLTKKAYSDLVAATSQLETRYGESQFWAFLDDAIEDEFVTLFRATPNAGDLTWAGSSLNGTVGDAETYQWTTGDGIAWRHFAGDALTFKVDVNGQQPPNVMGIDQHQFRVEDDGVMPDNNCTEYVIKRSQMPWLQTYMADCPVE